MSCLVQTCEFFGTDIAHLYTKILHAKNYLQVGNYKHGNDT